jgi:hypothetical protein
MKPIGKGITKFRLVLGSHLAHHYCDNALALGSYPTQNAPS